MFVDHSLWPPPPSEPLQPALRTMTDAQKKQLGSAIVAFTLAMVLAPLAGSLVIVGLVAIWRTLIG